MFILRIQIWKGSWPLLWGTRDSQSVICIKLNWAAWFRGPRTYMLQQIALGAGPESYMLSSAGMYIPNDSCYWSLWVLPLQQWEEWLSLQWPCPFPSPELCLTENRSRQLCLSSTVQGCLAKGEHRAKIFRDMRSGVERAPLFSFHRAACGLVWLCAASRYAF